MSINVSDHFTGGALPADGKIEEFSKFIKAYDATSETQKDEALGKLILYICENKNTRFPIPTKLKDVVTAGQKLYQFVEEELSGYIDWFPDSEAGNHD